ncbi:DUF3137 domain-containing protein [Gordonia otitidis]|uniref:DUF3137 domain-containing protein n=1 Tax=Gordonia otitidis (strain DSM 44809 / CCUG 52243 / JCM 12355 / NBRC 100426 / IFM 10032) TaxID=1108044 RepID=H5TQX1_GORO1|nr:DUF3137 domain-containing protein [Gordonia otitidis]UEA60813.1 DUF3137 domain-containing protein [Gordonia otitidis]GAB35879.1 hypothetical protein GOOTI_187_00140 [Gordonia otitidis NBRC 100426]
MTSAGPFWSRSWFTSLITAVTFVGLVAFHVWWWMGHGKPVAWILLLGTPFLAFLPAGVIAKLSQRRWAREWAQANGFAYFPETNWPVPTWDFPPFSTGRARAKRVRDGMSGMVGTHPATFFRYTWINNNRVQITTHQRSVFVLRLPTALPRLTLGTTMDLSTGKRVEFESEDFNSRFFVHSTDPGFAHAVFTPRTIDALMSLRKARGALLVTKIEIAGSELVATSTMASRPEAITAVFEVMRIIADGIPRYLWIDRGQNEGAWQ